jgi:hypothetical protein
MGACGNHRLGGMGRTSQCSLESVGTVHCIPTQAYRRPDRCSVEVYRTVPNDYSVSVRWKVKTLHCSLPMWTRLLPRQRNRVSKVCNKPKHHFHLILIFFQSEFYLR